MNVRNVIFLGATLGLVACGSRGNGSGNADGNVVASGNSAAVEKKHAYCFFKDGEMKDWKASRDAQGNVSIKGKAHVSDPRYKASVDKLETGSKKALLTLTIAQNDTGYARTDNWWPVAGTVPNSASVAQAEVMCGEKIVADLPVPQKS